ncbi:unnamed protein product [Soboliphyme baturini]|uniref:Kinetochore protein NDC80 n=1 Tax=Soboliphyme baturini TaxID=241478 RepID=A0A183J4D0_9BILA|nr:unnamed protein product [Soboliphyme baturini]
MFLHFLRCYQFSMEVSVKMLNPASTNNFMKISLNGFRLYMYLFICSGYRCSGRIEEEVPCVLNLLRYPFVVKKSVLQTVSSPHSWPHCLGILDWLRELTSVIHSFIPINYIFILFHETFPILLVIL